MSDLLPFFGNATFTIAAFVIALLVIVAVHEFGHYIVGRWTGIYAEVFSLGFGRVIWSRVDKHGTRWQLAMIPLGGYVRFLGDTNAASVGGTGKARNTMNGAPIWARSATVAAGPFANFLFSFLIFAGLMMTYGQAADPLTLRSVPTLSPSYTLELEPGDEILEISGFPATSVEALSEVYAELPIERVLDYRIRRKGAEMTVQGPYPSTTAVQSVNHDSAAKAAGVLEGDIIESIDGVDVWTFDQMIAIVSASDGNVLTLGIWRDGQSVEIAMAPLQVDYPQADGSFVTRWLLGVSGGSFFDLETEFPGVWNAAKGAVGQVWYLIKISLSAIYHMVAGNISTCNLSSPVGIAQTSGAMAAAGFADFIQFVGLLSTAIGLLNLLPIPVLDGGHLVFHAFEAITGRPPRERALRVLVAFGLAIIVSLMVVGFANDLYLCP